jgi:hypothetical protein
MMLTPVIIVRLASVPVGIAVGVWMALVIMVSLALPRPGRAALTSRMH